MKVPKQFQLAGAIWTVVEVANLTDSGLTHADDFRIELKKGMKKQLKEITFLHELVHAIKFTMGETSPHDEKEVDSFAQLLHQALTSMK